MNIYLATEDATPSIGNTIISFLQKRGVSVSTSYSNNDDSPTTSIDQSNAVVILFGEMPSTNTVAEAAYSFGADKPLLIIGTSESNVPFLLREVPFAAFGRLSEWQLALIQLLRESRRQPIEELREISNFEKLVHAFKHAPYLFDQIGSVQFESIVRDLFASKSTLTSDYAFANDNQAIDFAVSNLNDNQLTFVEVKKRKRNTRLSIDAVQRFFGAITAYGATHGILICPSGFSATARDFARRVKIIELWDMEKLIGFSKGFH